MIQYTLGNNNINLGNKLTKAWEEWDGHDEWRGIGNWLSFLDTLPEVTDSKWGGGRVTHLFFEHDSALSLFLLKWS